MHISSRHRSWKVRGWIPPWIENQPHEPGGRDIIKGSLKRPGSDVVAKRKATFTCISMCRSIQEEKDNHLLRPLALLLAGPPQRRVGPFLPSPLGYLTPNFKGAHAVRLKASALLLEMLLALRGVQHGAGLVTRKGNLGRHSWYLRLTAHIATHYLAEHNSTTSDICLHGSTKSTRNRYANPRLVTHSMLVTLDTGVTK